MTNIVCKTFYFENSGPENTEEILNLAKKRAEALGIQNIVVASTTGETGVKASQLFKGYNLVVVTHVTGFTKPNVQEFHPKNRDIIENKGAKIITIVHAFRALGRDVNKRFRTLQVGGIISNILRLFGQGVKVGCEVACMVTDADLIRIDKETVVIGGLKEWRRHHHSFEAK